MTATTATAGVISAQIHASQMQASATIAAAFIAALVGTVGAAFITSKVQKARNIQDRESQWRAHAVELTKIDVDRQIKTKGARYETRPAILDFLAFYRDLQELNETSPKDLYLKIMKKRINQDVNRTTCVISENNRCIISCGGDGADGHQLIFLEIAAGKSVICPYCNQKYSRPMK